MKEERNHYITDAAVFEAENGTLFHSSEWHSLISPLLRSDGKIERVESNVVTMDDEDGLRVSAND